MIRLDGVAAALARLAPGRAAAAMAAALEEQASAVAEAVRAGLEAPPGGDHSRPWLRTGALRDSVSFGVSGLHASVGSSDAAAAPQELGTLHLPPRPFLQPVAAAMGAGVAQAVGAAVVLGLGGPE